MKTFEKDYIGKGKQVANMQIVKISCRIKDILEHAHEYKDDQWITLEVSKLQNPDYYGNTHTVYVNKLVDAPKDDSKNQKKAPVKYTVKAKATKKAKTAEMAENIPF
ncbi:MAG TPA: hypothetical protein PKN44_13060 [Bacteroidales bacterium]|nr:hypothetical protein [Bacteroidales bacterium]